jgi:GNAT superfamily N-acetyltransferase
MFAATPSVLRCSRCGRFVDWAEARLQVICGCRSHVDLPPVLTRDAVDAERHIALDLFRRDFGRTDVAAFGEVVSLETVPGLIVAEMEGDLSGALAWRRRGEALHVVALATDPMWQRSGVGGHLLAEAEMVARREKLSRVIIATTNDNLPALYFYQRKGYRITEVVTGAGARHAAAPAGTGFAEIPVMDELRLEKVLPT